MAYGIQVFNTSAGTIQIDQDYRNLFYNRTVYYSDSASLLTILNSLYMTLQLLATSTLFSTGI
jgi:hypothetical protein